MIVISGASASGKTEIAKHLAEKYQIVKVITTTTRKERKGEVNGRDYFFVSNNDFEQMIKENKFVEYTTYNNNYYGSTKDQIKNDKCIVIDAAGLKSYIALKNKSIVTFFIEADEQTRFNRMVTRGDGVDKAQERIKNDRVAFAKENLPKVNYVIHSDNTISIDELTDKIYNLYINKVN